MEKQNFDSKSKPANNAADKQENETTEANRKLQEDFYDENESNGVNPANLNNQSAILTDKE